MIVHDAPIDNLKPPSNLPIIGENIPDEMKQLPQWGLWCFEYRPGKSKPWTKMPYQARIGKVRAATDNPEHWKSFQDVRQKFNASKGDYHGIGFWFADGGGLCGIDIDNCRNPETGELTPEAKAIVEAFPTYWEVSPSGTGIKGFCRGTVPGGTRRNGVELYPDGRYFTVTGHRLEGVPSSVVDCQEQLTALYARLKQTDKQQTNGGSNTHTGDAVLVANVDDSKILEVAAKGKGGAAFSRLWGGDTGGYPSHSEADLALCNRLAFFCGPDYDRIDSLFRRSGLMRDEKWEREDYRDQTIHKAIEGCQSFFNWKDDKPARKRQPVDKSKQAAMRQEWNVKSATATAPDYIDPKTDINCPEGRTEVANSRRFVEQFSDRVAYVAEWDKWIVWDGRRWAADSNKTVVALAKTVSDRIWEEASLTDSEVGKQFAANSAKAKAISAMLSLAKPDLAVSIKTLDRDPWLLNCTNGTVNLKTGELHEHWRDDYITKLCPVEYHPDAETYLYDRTLEAIFGGSRPLIDFWQRFAGYSLTGRISENAMLIAWGTGANGKSTLLNLLLETMGLDYSMQAPSDFLMVRNGEQHPTAQADLFGKRLVVCTETEENRALAESLVKQLTGGEAVRARRMREDFWQFDPTHKIVLCSNHKPRVKGNDHGIWRRLNLMPFTERFWDPAKGESGPAENRMDRTLPDRLRELRRGVLAWAVQGCLEWQRQGLNPPSAVVEATSEYRGENDAIGQFVEQECERGSNLSVRFSNLYAHMERWSNDNGEPLPRKRTVTTWLRESGYRELTNNGLWFQGLAIKALETE